MNSVSRCVPNYLKGSHKELRMNGMMSGSMTWGMGLFSLLILLLLVLGGGALVKYLFFDNRRK